MEHWTERDIGLLSRVSAITAASRLGRTREEVRAVATAEGIVFPRPAPPERLADTQWANAEAMWYQHRHTFLAAPHMARASRIAMQDQWEMCIALAIGMTTGWAQRRDVTMGPYRERQYYWPTMPGSESGWWLVSPRIEARADRLRGLAALLVMRGTGISNHDAVAAVLRRWAKTRKWRKYAAQISPPIVTQRPVSRRQKVRDRALRLARMVIADGMAPLEVANAMEVPVDVVYRARAMVRGAKK